MVTVAAELDERSLEYDPLCLVAHRSRILSRRLAGDADGYTCALETFIRQSELLFEEAPSLRDSQPGLLVELGKVYENLMVDLRPNSEKLIERGKGIVMLLAGLDYAESEKVFEASGRNVKVAVVMAKKGLECDEAKRVLESAGGFLATALGERS